MLREIHELVDRNPRLTPEDLRQAAAMLLEKQFIHLKGASDTERATYRLVTRHYKYFEDLFWATGWTLMHDAGIGLVGVQPAEGELYRRLRKDETLVLLVARQLYEDAVEHMQTEEGEVPVDSETILSRYESYASDRKRPVLTRYEEIVALFIRHGVFRKDGEDEESGLPRLRLLPALRVVTGDAFLDRAEAFVRNRAEGVGKAAETASPAGTTIPDGDGAAPATMH